MRRVFEHIGARVGVPGFWMMPANTYHADCAPQPSLSASVAKVLLDESPAHAWAAHPRLNPEPQEESGSSRMDFGTIVHALVLGRGRQIVVVYADNWTTKAAKAARDDARAAGKTPVLVKDFERAKLCAAAAVAHVRSVEGCENVFEPDHGQSEVAMVWQDEAGPWCRSMVDWLPNDRRVLWDIKTTALSANPAHAGKLIANMGYDLAAGFYERGLIHLEPEMAGRVTFRWVMVEVTPPFACSIVQIDATGLTIGRRKTSAAIDAWRRCREADAWPAYPARICVAEYPQFAENRWLEREMRDAEQHGPIVDSFSDRVHHGAGRQPVHDPLMSEIVP
jgi:hypothetical protein